MSTKKRNISDNIAFVDVETTGTDPVHDRIIEIAIVRTENNQVVERWQSLVDPQARLPDEIVQMTGIRPDNLERAETFRQIADKVADLLEGCVFCAHNARFDYGFLKQEFKRVGIEMKLKQLCTVRLSRALFPGEMHHNLDAVAKRNGIVVQNRHRAGDDAEAIRQFYQLVIQKFDGLQVDRVVKQLIRYPNLPQKLKDMGVKSLPERPGVYIFYGETGMPLYVGKSLNIKDRVAAHFSRQLSDKKEMRMNSEVVDVETETCEGEFHALIREVELIKKLQPLHNRRLRNSGPQIIVRQKFNEQGYKTSEIETGSLPDEKTYGIFSTKKQAEDYLRNKCQEFGLCEKLTGIEKMRKTCFKSELGKCQACTGTEDPIKYNLRFDMAMADDKIPAWPFAGEIAIKEGTKSFVFDQWCLLGEATGENYLEKERKFDRDIFNILKKYIINAKNRKNITEVDLKRVDIAA